MMPWEIEDRWERYIRRTVNTSNEIIFLEDCNEYNS